MLGSPLSAIRFLLADLPARPGPPPVRAGEIATTGTLTDAVPLPQGEHWSTSLSGIDLPGLRVSFA